MTTPLTLIPARVADLRGDVAQTAPTNRQPLAWVASTSKWTPITLAVADVEDLADDLAALAPLDSPTFTGTIVAAAATFTGTVLLDHTTTIVDLKIKSTANKGAFPGNLQPGEPDTLAVSAGRNNDNTYWFADFILPNGSAYRMTEVDATWGQDGNTAVQLLKATDSPGMGWGVLEAVNHSGLLFSTFPNRPILFFVNRIEKGRFTSDGFVATVIAGSVSASGTLSLTSTTHATKNKIFLGASAAFDEANVRLGLGTTSPIYQFDQRGSGILANWSNGFDQDLHVDISPAMAGDKRAFVQPSTDTALVFGAANTEVLRVTSASARLSKPLVLATSADAAIPNGGIAWSTDDPGVLKVRTPAGVLKTVTLA